MKKRRRKIKNIDKVFTTKQEKKRIARGRLFEVALERGVKLGQVVQEKDKYAIYRNNLYI